MAPTFSRNSQSNWIPSGRAGLEFRLRRLAGRILFLCARRPPASRRNISLFLTTPTWTWQSRSKTFSPCCALGRSVQLFARLSHEKLKVVVELDRGGVL